MLVFVQCSDVEAAAAARLLTTVAQKVASQHMHVGPMLSKDVACKHNAIVQDEQAAWVILWTTS